MPSSDGRLMELWLRLLTATWKKGVIPGCLRSVEVKHCQGEASEWLCPQLQRKQPSLPVVLKSAV